MKSYFDLIVLIPVGPNSDLDFIKDSINSIKYYCRCSLKIVLSDDSKQKIGVRIKNYIPEIDILENKKSYGAGSGLYMHLSYAYKYIIQKYSFKTLLKHDTDALVIGINPQEQAEQLFKNNPKIGMAGLHLTRISVVDFNNNVFNNWWPRYHIMQRTSSWQFIKKPISNYILRKLLFKALANGYELGENVFGGAYFLSEALLLGLEKAKLLAKKRLFDSGLEEDHLFSLLAKVINYDLGDLASNSLPFGCAWNALPASPEVLHSNGKKIIHSTRLWKNLREYEIRQFFKKIREA